MVGVLGGPSSLATLLNMSCGGSVCSLTARASDGGVVPLRLSFYTPSIVRWWLAIDGNFSDIGAAADLLVVPPQGVACTALDQGEYYEVSQVPPSSVKVHVQKAPVLLTILVDGQVVVQESSPTSWNSTSTWQSLFRDVAPFPQNLTSEYFFGGGMQNGRFSHRDQRISIGVSYNWDDGGNPNSAPWFVSSAGYGLLRNTWAPGEYDFVSPVTLTHNDSNRLDSFFMVTGPISIKKILGLYTQLTGPPFLPPLYGLFLGG